MTPISTSETRIEFNIPARGLIGFRSEFLTETRGRGIMNHNFNGYEAYKGDIKARYNGALIAWETGEAATYGMLQVEDRGILFIKPGTKVYEGMIVGMNNRDKDLEINVCKRKHLTNMRASGSDETLKLKEPRLLSLEESIEFINDDELVEITPTNVRMRKKVLNKDERAKYNKQLSVMKAQ
jgi:GTP-binding protein